MAFPLPAPSISVCTPPGDFDGNYRRLKKLINKALKDGTPLQDLHLLPKNPCPPEQKPLLRNDLLELLRVIRSIRVRFQELLWAPVPPELVRDILAKNPEQRLPWEDEALEKAGRWSEDVKAVRAQARKELNDHLSSKFFRFG